MDLYMSGFIDNQKFFDVRNKEHTIQNSKSRNCFFSPVHCHLLMNNPEHLIYFVKVTSDKKLPKDLNELKKYLG
ncbi:Hypothetical protein SRAE_2000455400 [Strongyloides ratti]|uniref:Uncharacterized protein n=1 Tax=Strongyloides ratti TaxID=34506 RepID=A0A090LJL6_STRRB|nr:Hypothetical protein SRAE_2000455400 [Strongyloides ratti]CEF69908.1 Hypothetical protein SRAE_2000455400 [Strongyloides ratti]